MSPRWPPIPPIWRGETVYVIGGGPSFEAVNPDRLRGRNIVVVNTSWTRVPFADVLFFGDDRWWRHWKAKVSANFAGRIVSTTHVSDIRVSKLRNTAARRGLAKKPPFLLSADPMSVPMRRTSLAPAINVAAHLLGMSGRIVLMGADGKMTGKQSHHHAPHPWPVRPGCWDIQRRDLAELAPQLSGRGIEIVNASPGSAWDIWPVVSPDEVLT
jgi:hypothetical protein